MPSHSTVALLRTSPATVQDDYCRLLELAAPALVMPAAVVALGHRGHMLPGERAEPWQLAGMLRALGAGGCAMRVVLPSDDPADPLAGVVRAANVSVQPPGPPPGPAVYLCGAGQADQLVELALAGTAPALCVVDAVTLRSGTGDSTRLDIRGALLASTDPVALAALLGRLMGRTPRAAPALALAHERGLGCADLRRVELGGDTDLARGTWDTPHPRERSTPLDRLTVWFARAAGLAVSAEERAYEDWVFYTSWGRLYRRYQRRAIARR